MIARSQSDSLPRLLVIGAGPAGVSAAIRLRDRGAEVLLVDRARFPRDKVCGCCLNLAAIHSLARIGCDHRVTSLCRDSLQRWEMRMGNQRIEAALPGGIAISRRAMDTALIEEAVRRGVQLRTGCEARVMEVTADGATISLPLDGARELAIRFDSVVFASGLSGGGVSQWLPFVQSPMGPIGVGVILDSVDQVVPRTIHMVCGSGGYVGLVQLEDGRIDMAAAIRRTVLNAQSLNRSEIATRVDQLLRGAGMPELAVANLDRLQMTPPLTRSRRVGFGGLIAIGDAAFYSEPFTGEGMAWAIESGIEAADCIADRLEGATSPSPSLGEAWLPRYRALSRRRRWICRAMSAVLRTGPAANWLAPLMRAAPWGVRFAIEQLNVARK